MHLSRTALMVTAAVGAVIIVVITAMIFMGLLGREEPTRDDPRSLHEGVCPEGHRALRAGRQTEDNRILQRSREHGRSVVRCHNRRERLHDSALQPGAQGKRPQRTRGCHRPLLRGRRDGGHRGGTLGGVPPPESSHRTEPEETNLGGKARRPDLRLGLVRVMGPEADAR